MFIIRFVHDHGARPTHLLALSAFQPGSYSIIFCTKRFWDFRFNRVRNLTHYIVFSFFNRNFRRLKAKPYKSEVKSPVQIPLYLCLYFSAAKSYKSMSPDLVPLNRYYILIVWLLCFLVLLDCAICHNTIYYTIYTFLDSRISHQKWWIDLEPNLEMVVSRVTSKDCRIEGIGPSLTPFLICKWTCHGPWLPFGLSPSRTC